MVDGPGGRGAAGRAAGAFGPHKVAGVVAVVVVVVDLGSKWLAMQLDGVVALVDVHHNHDLALGVATLHGPRSLLLAALTAAAVAHLVVRHRRGTAPAWVLPTLAGGGLANGLDRVVDGSVTDWLALGPIVLNVADLALVVALGAHAWGVLTQRAPEAMPAGARPTHEGR